MGVCTPSFYINNHRNHPAISACRARDRRKGCAGGTHTGTSAATFNAAAPLTAQPALLCPSVQIFPKDTPPFSNYSIFSNCPPRALYFQETYSGVKDFKICQTSIPQPWPSSKVTSCQGRPREKAALHHPLTLLTEMQEQIISHSSASRDNNLFSQHYAVIVQPDQTLSLMEKLFLRDL